MSGRGNGRPRLPAARTATILATLLALAALAALVPATSRALPCDPTQQDCTGGGGGGTTIYRNLTVTVTGPGTVSDGTVSCTAATSPCTWRYENLDVANPTATPNSGYSLSAWGGACSGTGACSITMSADKAVSAAFRDSQPPAVSLTAPTAGPRAGTFAFAATAADNAGVSRVDFSIRGTVRASDSTAPYGGSFDSRTISDGAAAVVAIAYDTSGNLTQSAPVVVTVDNTAPALGVSGPSGDVFGGGSTQSWTLSSSDATSGVASVTCSVVATGQPASFHACSGGTSSHSVTNLAEGDYTFTARAVDAAGNTRDVSRAFSIDTTPPVSTITGGPEDGSTTDAQGATFTFTQADAHPGTFQCSYDGAAFAACPGGVAGQARYDGVVRGVHTFAVEAVDAAGNVEAAPVSRSWTVTGADGVIAPPTIAAPAIGADPIVSGDGAATITFASDDPDTKSFACQVDGDGAPQPCTSPWTVHLATGQHTVYVHGVNGSGTRGPAATRTFRVVRRPDTTLGGTPSPGGVALSGRTAFTYASTAPGATLSCTLDGHPVPCTANVGPLADGAHTITVRSGISPFDPDVTYWDSTPATRTFVVDTHAPATTIGGGPASATTDTTARFSFAGRDPSPGTALHYECRLDGGPWARCAPGASYAALATGPHSFAVRAVDAAGNADATPAAWSWMVIADADRDGFFTPSDCDDSDAAVHPGARDVPGDRIDQDCSGGDAPAKTAPAHLRASWAVHGSTTGVRELTLTRLAGHAKVALACTGGGCPFSARTAKIRHGRAQLTVLFRHHALRKGARLVLRVTAPGRKARTIRITIRSGHPPKVAGA